jgi:hypothetical protein
LGAFEKKTGNGKGEGERWGRMEKFLKKNAKSQTNNKKEKRYNNNNNNKHLKIIIIIITTTITSITIKITITFLKKF